MSDENTSTKDGKMKFICKYKTSPNTTFHVDVEAVDLEGFSGPYKTTRGKSTKVSYDSDEAVGRWLWNEVNCVRIKLDN